MTAEIRSYLEGIAAKSETDRELLQAVRSEMKEKEAKTEAVLQAKDANICQLVDQVKQLTKATQELMAKAADGPPSLKKQRRQQQQRDMANWPKCPNCGRKVGPKNGHKPALCWELEANAHLRPEGWKSCKAAPE